MWGQLASPPPPPSLTPAEQFTALQGVVWTLEDVKFFGYSFYAELCHDWARKPTVGINQQLGEANSRDKPTARINQQLR